MGSAEEKPRSALRARGPVSGRPPEPVRPPAAPAQRPADPETSSDSSRTNASAYLVTPFSTVPRRLARSFPGQLAYCVLIFSLLPTVLFSYWTYKAASVDLPHTYRGLGIGLPFAALWAFLSPLWILIGENAAARWLVLAMNDTRSGWNARGAERWQRRVNRIYYPMSLLGAVGGAIIFAFVRSTPLEKVAELPGHWGLAVGFIVIAQTGFIALTGLYGVIRWVAVVMAATSRADLAWQPFQAQRPPALSRVYQVSLMGAVFFSCAALFIPTLLVIAAGQLHPVARVVLWTFMVLMFFGGLLIFTLPIAAVVAALRRGKSRYLEPLESRLDRLIGEFLGDPTPRHQDSLATADAIQRLLAIRGCVTDARVFPLARTVSRALLTVVIPIASLLLSVIQANIVTF